MENKIYNPKNIEIKKNDIEKIFSDLGLYYKINNIDVYQTSFVHQSYVKSSYIEINETCPYKCVELKEVSNERLEFLGDGILEAITKFYLYKRFPNADEGFMTETKISLIKNEHIGKLAYELGLNKWYLLSCSSEEKKTRVNYKKLGCLFESFLGAFFLDSNNCDIEDNTFLFKTLFSSGPGFQYCQLFIEKIFDKIVDWTYILEKNDNYKNTLQILLQKQFKKTPEYIIIQQDEELKYHMGVYLSFVDNPDYKNAVLIEQLETFEDFKKHSCILLGKDNHKIKKKAEQGSCSYAIEKLNRFE